MSNETSKSKQVIFITGATGYLGSRLTKHFTNSGYSVVCTSTNSHKLAELKKEVLSLRGGAEIRTWTCDFSSQNNLEELIHFLEGNKINHFINCAALQGKLISNAKSFDKKEFRRVFAVNFECAMFLTFYFASIWTDKQMHAIIHFSGGGAATPRPYFNSYSISKTSLVRFVENCSKMADFGRISINAVAPGPMPSQMQEAILSHKILEGTEEHIKIVSSTAQNLTGITRVLNLCSYLLSQSEPLVSGRLISAQWDNWEEWSKHPKELEASDVFTLRRIVGKDRGIDWGDKV